MLACTDVFYPDVGDEAKAACLLFEKWESPSEVRAITEDVKGIAPYEPGAFYKRELPCLLAVLKKANTPLEVIVIDGYVWLSGDGRPGLGAYLYEALGGSTIVVGVAKTSFIGSGFAVPVVRGKSQKPLYVTSRGVEPAVAAGWIQRMHGPHRLPRLLKQVDSLCRAG